MLDVGEVEKLMEGVTLLKGGHSRREDGVCAMELVAWIAGRPHSDHPECVSPVLGAFVRRWNDDLDGLRLAGARPHAPAWLDLAGITDAAAALRALSPLRSPALLRAAWAPLADARTKAAAAGDAAWDAAWVAAGEVLEPTKVSLQQSAFDLLDLLIVGE